MTLERFQEIYFAQRGNMNKKVFISEQEEEDYGEAVHSDSELSRWYLKQQILESGVHVGTQCCLNMEYHLLENYLWKKDPSQYPDFMNYDSVIAYDETRGNYGLPIHDGGSSYISIEFCPWCGNKLNNLDL